MASHELRLADGIFESGSAVLLRLGHLRVVKLPGLLEAGGHEAA